MTRLSGFFKVWKCRLLLITDGALGVNNCVGDRAVKIHTSLWNKSLFRTAGCAIIRLVGGHWKLLASFTIRHLTLAAHVRNWILVESVLARVANDVTIMDWFVDNRIRQTKELKRLPFEPVSVLKRRSWTKIVSTNICHNLEILHSKTIWSVDQKASGSLLRFNSSV